MSDRLLSLLQALEGEDVSFVLVGGMAAVLHGAPIATQDIDIVPELSAENIARLTAVLDRLGARYRGQPKGRVIKPSIESFQGTGHHNLMTDLGPIDILLEIEPRWGFNELAPRSTWFESEEVRVRVLDLPQLIEAKQSTKRAKDQLVLPILLSLLERKST